MIRISKFFFIVITLLTSSVFATEFLPYQIIDLGTLGGNKSYGYDVNNLGQVVGYAYVDSSYEYHAFLWDIHTGMIDLGTPGLKSNAKGINDHGQISGWQDGKGMFWDKERPVEIGTVTWPRRINNAAVITGYTRNGGFPYDPFIWSESKGMIRLGGMGTVNHNGHGFDINDQGQVVGRCEITTPIGIKSHAFLWEDRNQNDKADPGEMEDLGLLPEGDWSEAYGNNENGQVVGAGGGLSNQAYAFLWDRTQGMKNIGLETFGPHRSYAMDINNHGQIIGGCWEVEADGFIWQNGEYASLSSLLVDESTWYELNPVAINDQGWIVGNGRAAYLEPCHAFVMIPIPEPTTLSLFAVGSVVLRRRRKAKIEKTEL